MTKNFPKPSNAYAALNTHHRNLHHQEWPVLEALAAHSRDQSGRDRMRQYGTMIPLRGGPGGLLLLDELPANFDGQIWLLPRKPAQVIS